MQSCVNELIKCKDGKRCIKQSSLCDGKMQCMDNSDEENCIHHVCLSNARKCADNIQCVQEDAICDGAHHCSGVAILHLGTICLWSDKTQWGWNACENISVGLCLIKVDQG